ncbi:hypothetical protein HYH02_000393 [Chlamydomonas schloesseri]|uniref:Glycosyltransferase n=1 Tax=Chlamydomonas schloesseri TaxID=2026947 RepID=A0A835WWN1_9CHLO|nr:hypothetical protein HYH02_000393 [Chlamydomonas schloesseri]|eukprot:KAG2454548.1 hypothetical protein HYH02_000393 [Chlamydomonas schloesseri]
MTTREGDDSAAAPAAAPPGGLDKALVVFARLPVPGRVKTRLAAGLGADAACTWYRACAHHAIEQAACCSGWADVSVYHSSADDTADVEAWLQGEGLLVPCRPQLGASAAAGAAPPDLGAKMRAAMHESQQRLVAATATAAGAAVAAASSQAAEGIAAQREQPREQQSEQEPAGTLGQSAGPHNEDGNQPPTEPGLRRTKVIITGTDIPDVSQHLFAAAAGALDTYDMVIGPSADGGYYMLGLTAVAEQLFEGMPWSTEVVCSETLARAAAAGLRVAPLETLPRLRDVDTVEDLAEWVAGCSSAGAGEAPAGPAEGALNPEWTPRKLSLLEMSRGILASAGKQ